MYLAQIPCKKGLIYLIGSSLCQVLCTLAFASSERGDSDSLNPTRQYSDLEIAAVQSIPFKYSTSKSASRCRPNKVSGLEQEVYPEPVHELRFPSDGY